MEVCRRSSWLLSLLGVILLAEALQGVQGVVEIDGPSETECRPYIEKALRELETVGAGDADAGQSNEEASTIDNISLDDKESDEQRSAENFENENETQKSKEEEPVSTSKTEQQEETELKTDKSTESSDTEDDKYLGSSQKDSKETEEDKSVEDAPETLSTKHYQEDLPEERRNKEATTAEGSSASASVETVEDAASLEETEDQILTKLSAEDTADETNILMENIESSETVEEEEQRSAETTDTSEILIEQKKENQSVEETIEEVGADDQKSEDGSEESKFLETQSDENDTNADNKSATSTAESDEDNKSNDDSNEYDDTKKTKTSGEDDSHENSEDIVNQKQDDIEEKYQPDEPNTNAQENQETEEQNERKQRSVEESGENDSQSKKDDKSTNEDKENDISGIDTERVETKESNSIELSKEDENEEKAISTDTEETTATKEERNSDEEGSKEEKKIKATENDQKSETTPEHEDNVESAEELQNESKSGTESSEDADDAPEEDLVIEIDVPGNLRSRDYVEQLLKLDREATKTEEIVDRISEITLRELKRLYENAIKPLETVYKYRDLSNRHYGDAEIFSKPLILFMGPWSGGKSTIINYLLNIEYNDTALRTGAEPSPAYFNLLMHGGEEEILDGTQLAADYTFSGLQKFGQGLEERLRGIKLPSKLLEKVNIAEIPGILEVRKQVSRVFPFNDACQWFIDRADIIFLVYDPSKLDVGPETEAILDQLKGREYQTRIVLNKADQIKPEELMRVQGALIWNISPLMSSPQPPVMYTTSLWSRPYEHWAPVRLLQSQERAFLRDLRSAVDKRIENKIASARRFAVRVRNHAKMVDCYLTTYYNHKSIFGNRKQVADTIIEHPQDYHIYEGLSTLTNISRYDLPDPDVYKDFFRLNPLYEFQQLSATCTYFRGCPINKLDVAIAYDFPELVGKHKRLVEAALTETNQNQQAQGS